MSRTSFLHWAALWRSLNASGDPAPWHQRLIAAYTESQRHYHTLRHLDDCLREWDAVRSLAKQPHQVELALWFHDAVYDPRSLANEERSADLATACLNPVGIDLETVNAIRDLILCTKTHQPSPDPDAVLLLDIDLAILGQPADRFWEYERAIRAEYAWVPEATYRQKRAEILVGFSNRERIYTTDRFSLSYETNARANLAAAIDALHSPSS